jgi:WD40 repeat protein
VSKGKEPAFALQQTLEGHATIVYPLKVSADGRTVVSGSADNTVRVWNLDA